MDFIVQTNTISRLPSVDGLTVCAIVDAENDWLNRDPRNRNAKNENAYELLSVDDTNSENVVGKIPVGSVEYCAKVSALQGHANTIPALNIPEILRDRRFTHRDVSVEESVSGVEARVKAYGSAMVKPADAAKRFPALLIEDWRDTGKMLASYAPPYFVSELLSFDTQLGLESEWRVFYHRADTMPVGVQPYAFRYRWPQRIPSQKLVSEMLEAARPQMLDGTLPSSGTMDVAVLENGDTVLVEMHPFIACGLYGFEERIVLPMLRNAWRWQSSLEVESFGI